MAELAPASPALAAQAALAGHAVHADAASWLGAIERLTAALLAALVAFRQLGTSASFAVRGLAAVGLAQLGAIDLAEGRTAVTGALLREARAIEAAWRDAPARWRTSRTCANSTGMRAVRVAAGDVDGLLRCLGSEVSLGSGRPRGAAAQTVLETVQAVAGPQFRPRQGDPAAWSRNVRGHAPLAAACPSAGRWLRR